jgi:hypothetical protein
VTEGSQRAELVERARLRGVKRSGPPPGPEGPVLEPASFTNARLRRAANAIVESVL